MASPIPVSARYASMSAKPAAKTVTRVAAEKMNMPTCATDLRV